MELVNATREKSSTVNNAIDIDCNDVLETMEILLKYITKTPKNKGKKHK